MLFLYPQPPPYCVKLSFKHIYKYLRNSICSLLYVGSLHNRIYPCKAYINKNTFIVQFSYTAYIEIRASESLNLKYIFIKSNRVYEICIVSHNTFLVQSMCEYFLFRTASFSTFSFSTFRIRLVGGFTSRSSSSGISLFVFQDSSLFPKTLHYSAKFFNPRHLLYRS